ncbi:MAG: chorismate-binding protein [Propionibacteriaceae bacterium]|nr:chorismate-binding protein [Propionibacteriaceae bacterium]
MLTASPESFTDLPIRSTVRSQPREQVADLLAWLPDADLACWVRHGQGLVAGGRAITRTFTCATEANAWWQALVMTLNLEIDPALADEPMAGPIAFLSFPFSPTGRYEMVVPEVIIGQREGRAWVTTWNEATPTPPHGVANAGGQSGRAKTPHLLQRRTQSREDWLAIVEQAIRRIRAGELDKVVLARDETFESSEPIPLRSIITALAQNYPQTWTFCVKGLVGASPELLVRQDRGLITSRVLAGTIHGEVGDDSGLAEALSSSSKDLIEHQYAVASVAEALRDHTRSLHVPEVPFVLQLPNVMHLATDITGVGVEGCTGGSSTVISLAAAIHPSAAVCGTPRAEAAQLIDELEGLDRGRYAGPVGWINAQGDGEVALALRCGQVDDRTIRIYAGAGIVADSIPADEWEETRAKLRPMTGALGL